MSREPFFLPVAEMIVAFRVNELSLRMVIAAGKRGERTISARAKNKKKGARGVLVIGRVRVWFS